ncbi:hypothetical protein BO94DRAFT_590440 [Aspergillus sclerotioniger CBS 115572]|uniref:C2H2-type domain-containing protein n=1 Tax=Aspergillus sclerotioniger CBS 115572 TaxID=1450535 RepID=A0A317V9I5_9EURO|nr:hypothetical protein BO94DRAFT_590440 [Aspergillus sclerotioniger CBS 115572]PWY69657.1 hypothetical protein BO94DRAFT_590440 [Aspergillus sclerotioniger CBS 115572]
MAQNFRAHQNRGTDRQSAAPGGYVYTDPGHSPHVSSTRRPAIGTQTNQQVMAYENMPPANLPFDTDVIYGDITQAYANHTMVDMGYNTGPPVLGTSASNDGFIETQQLPSFPEPQITVPGSSSIDELFPTSFAATGHISRESQLTPRTSQSRLRCEWKGCNYRNSFNRPTDLIRHVKTIHILPHSFTCDVPGCDKTFSRKDNFMEHKLRVHRFVRRQYGA